MRVALRLDDGTLISAKVNGSAAAMTAKKLTAEEAYAAGKLGPEHVQKAKVLLYKMQCLLQGDKWVDGDVPAPNPVDLKRKADGIGQVAQPGGKRMRGLHSHMGNGYHGAAPSPSEVSRDSLMQNHDFEMRCLHIVTAVLQSLGPDSFWFDRPVDGKQIPDYYTIVKKAMDLGTIQKKLRSHQYANPQEFYQDMDQVWKNCNLYNKKGDPVQKAGARGEETFQQEWARTGFDTPGGARARRATAGVAAEKYEPQLHAPPEKKRTYSQPGRTASKQPARSNRQHGAGKHDAVEQRVRQWTPEHTQLVTDVLVDLSDEITDAVVEIVQDYSDPSNEGEIELDLDKLPPEALWRLYDLIIGKGIRAPIQNAQPTNHVVLMSGSDNMSSENSG